MHLRNDLSLRTYPILSTTGFECGKTRMYPTNGLYGPSFATPYGGAVFLDYTRARVETIGSQSSCQEAVDRLSTPKLSFRTLPDAIKNGQTLHLYAILHQGADPLRYLPVTFTIGRGAQRETCASTTLPPSGEASCEIRPVAQPVGRQPVTISFAGTETLRAASSTAPVLIEPISGACASAASAQPGIIAVFGHAPTATEARKLQARAESVGFQEVVVEQVDCADFRVVLHGIPNRKVGADFQREARNAGFDVVIESG